jgi:1-acyl-sn-glycerol-3-phosphate acyltransferase
MSLPRPHDYAPPPPPSAGDGLRTIRALVRGVLPTFLRLGLHRVVPAPSTSTPEGLLRVRATFGAIVRDLGIDLDVVHEERVPSQGGLVLMWNQESHLDHLVLAAAIPRPFFSLFNNEVARFPIYGAHMRATGHVHVDRNDEAQWRVSIAEAADRVKAGECVLVSPEGTRSWDGELLPMKRGAFLLAAASMRPVVCTTVIGGHERLPRGAAFVRRGAMRVVFSEPIANDGDADALALRVAETFTTTKHANRLLR